MKRIFLAPLIVVLVLGASGCGYFTSASQRVAEAEDLIGQGEQRRALIELRNALHDEPKNPKARLLLGEIVLWMGDPAGAERELKQVPDSFDPAKRADLALRIDLAAGRAQDVLERVGTPKPDDATAWVYRGQALLTTGKPAEAQSAFESALAADPKDLAAAVGVIECHAAQGDAAGALVRARDLVKARPDASLAHFIEGAVLARGTDARAAAESLERARQNAASQLDIPRQVTLLATLIEVQIANRELDKAKATADALGRVVPGSPLAALMSARVSMASSDYAGAASGLRRIVNGAPEFTRARFMLGVALAAQGNLEQASQELSTVVEQMPENIEARQLLAQLRMRLEDPAGAMRVLVPALEADATDAGLNQLFEEARLQSDSGGESLAVLEAELQKSPDNHGLRLQLARAYLSENLPAKARALLASPAAGEKPDPVGERLLLAAIARTDGVAAARNRLDRMLAARPDDPDLTVLAAQARLAQGQADEAEGLLAEAVGRSPAHAGARLALARLQIARGKRDVAISHLEIVRKDDPHAVEARLLLAQLALQRDDAKLAQAFVAEAVAGAESVAATRNAAGSLYLDTARYDAAIEQFLAATAVDPTDPLLWLNLGRAQLALNQFDAARTSLQRALKLRDRWLPAEGMLAFLDLQQGRGDAALARALELVKLRPDEAGVHVLEAEVRGAQRQFVEAEAAVQAAARIQPAPGLAMKAYQLRVAGERPNPTEPLEEWISRHPDDLMIRGVLAQAQVQAGAAARAIQQYEQIVARQPRDAVSLNNLAWLYFESGDRRAADTARKARALAPESPAIADTLGWILVQDGKVAEGLALIEKAAEQAPNDGDLQFHYAAALVKAGRTADAAARLRAVLDSERPFSSRQEAERLLAGLNKGAGSGG